MTYRNPTLSLSAAAAIAAAAVTSTMASASTHQKKRMPRRNLKRNEPERYLSKDALPGRDSGRWSSLDEEGEASSGVEFLSAHSMLEHLDDDATKGAEEQLPPSLMNQLRKLQTSTLSDPYQAQPFVEGESEYDEYQQAWRYLGFIIDCNAGGGDDDDYYGGSGSGDTGEGCQRHVIWAAYVDLDYAGGGIGEYQYWDRTNFYWDKTACKYDANDDDPRCAKMDCHNDDTHFSLLGFFKHASHDDWMEQLFKHEGYCVWTEEEYEFMDNARDAWPEGCSYAGSAAEFNNYDDNTEETSAASLYYDLKPTANGYFTIGLYTDTRCVVDYTGMTSVEDVLGNIIVEGGSGSGDGDYSDTYTTFEQSLSAWDSSFDAWRICQPCLAHDLNNVGYGYDDDSMHGSNYGATGDDDAGGDGEDFACYDDAGYTNVNQCMKFMAKTSMKTATFRDLTLAHSQGSIISYATLRTAPDADTPSTGGAIAFFLFANMFAAFGGYQFYKVRKEIKKKYHASRFLKQPLAATGEVA